jgi:hypothetical protein
MRQQRPDLQSLREEGAMRLGKICFYGALVCMFCLIASVKVNSAPLDAAWVTFEKFHSPENSKFLVQINSTGQVLVSEKRVINTGAYGSAGAYGSEGANWGGYAAALSNAGSNMLNLWVIDRKGTLVRIIVNKLTFKVSSIIHTKAHSTNPLKIQVTNRGNDNFLALQTSNGLGQDLLTAVSINPAGVLLGKSWQLSAEPFGGDWECSQASGCGGGVSADGRMAFYVTSAPHNTTRLFVRPLGNRGRPDAHQVLVDTLQSESGGLMGVDVSGRLADGSRILLYVARRRVIHGEIADSLYTEKIDAAWGTKTGQRLQIKRLPDLAAGQGATIDPMGRFVLYVDNYENQLMFQSLDTLGNATGPSRVIASSVSGGLDILRN